MSPISALITNFTSKYKLDCLQILFPYFDKYLLSIPDKDSKLTFWHILFKDMDNANRLLAVHLLRPLIDANIMKMKFPDSEMTNCHYYFKYLSTLSKF